MNVRLPVHAAFVWLACLACVASTAEIETGLDLYSQGGVVVDGVAYFTANDSSRREGVTRTADYPCVVAFDAETHKKIRTYDFEFTYDSSPLVVQDSSGVWLVIAHEHKRARTVAVERDSGNVRWTSAANQPGNYFFGYSFYDRSDGTRLVLMACKNGLHALSADTGEDIWWVQRSGTGGVTPCVDRETGVVFFQCNGKVLKIQADDGQVMKEVDVPWPNVCISWNTVLIDDAHGDFVATRWYGQPEWDSAIRVYDHDLNLVWQKVRLPNGKKDTLTYVDEKLICGSGNGWSKIFSGDLWEDRVVVTRIAENCHASWPGPFGDPQKNHMTAVTETEATLVPMVEVGQTETTPYKPNLAADARILAESRIRDEQADVARMTDGAPDRWWSTGPGDLAIDPVDVDVQFKKSHVVDAVVLTTSTLKGQLRLKAFDLFAGLEGVWDGEHPLAKIRNNLEKTVRVEFPPVHVDRLRIRLLGSHRPNNDFAHIAELVVSGTFRRLRSADRR